MTRRASMGVGVIRKADACMLERLGHELRAVIDDWTQELPQGVRSGLDMAIEDMMSQLAQPGHVVAALRALITEIAHELALYNDTQDADALGNTMYEAVMARLAASAIAA